MAIVGFQDVAAYIKEEFDRRFGTTWHCVVGKSFGSRVEYLVAWNVAFHKRHVSIMIFKCGYWSNDFSSANGS